MHVEDVTMTNVIIKTLDRKWNWGENDIMPRSNGLGILVIFEKAVSWDLSLGEASWFLSLGEASPVGAYGMRRAFVVSDGTVSIVKIVSLSPRVENLKVKKVIKVLYLNYRESSVFFGISMHMNILRICKFYIFVFWICYTKRFCSKFKGWRTFLLIWNGNPMLCAKT